MKWITDGSVRLPKKGEWYCGNGDMPRQAQSNGDPWSRLILTPLADGSIVVPPEMVERLRDAMSTEEIVEARSLSRLWATIEVVMKAADDILSLAAPPKSAELTKLETLRDRLDRGVDEYAAAVRALLDAEIEREKAKR